MGRFANQLFQHAFLNVYGNRQRATVQEPPWVGNALFGARAPLPRPLLTDWHERIDAREQSYPPNGDEALGKNFVGYGQFHTSWYAPDREFLRGLFQPVAAVRQRMASAVEKMKARGSTTVGVHIRRGDYGRSIFYITPVEWYLDCLAKLWPTLDRPALFISTEDASLVERFVDYSPVTTKSLGVDLKAEPMPFYQYLLHDRITLDPVQLDFYPDFHLLSQCDVLLTPNSTFSFFAAMLNPTLREFYRSSLQTQGFAKEDPWDAYPLTHDRVEDFSHVPGIRTEANPWWIE